jgi:chemosensory pili system protein ChpC
MIAEEIGEDINCVVLPIGALGLLVPSVCVAEVLPWRRIREVGNTPDWMIGTMTWRGDAIPVARFEKLNGSTDPASQECECVAVMNRCRSAHGQAFYAMATDGLPRMVQVGEADVHPEQTHLGVAESAAIRLGTEQLRIPNLGYIEDQLMTLRPGQATLLT